MFGYKIKEEQKHIFEKTVCKDLNKCNVVTFKVPKKAVQEIIAQTHFHLCAHTEKKIFIAKMTINKSKSRLV